MTHQINLLQLGTRARGPRLSLAIVVGSAMASAALVAALASQADHETRLLGERVATLEQAAKAHAAADSAGAELRVLGASEAILNQRKAAIAELTAAAERDRQGYAGFLRALSRATTDGAWLVGVTVDRKGATLHGRALAPARIGAYLGQLQAEPDFAGHAFSTVEFRTAQNRETASAATTSALGGRPDAIEFTLSTRDAEAAQVAQTTPADKR